ncbi:ABC transporter ATP-binding protein [Halegenticoccus soli]|uniref:ABC transporter ATP-binding protein n=1 Tax=Halegenticoccus soli TaxID=1985678 RepID=UPI000C6E725C|nr:energy-coupling factor transporter ATPase [Halegenticoccus soli]
MALIDVDDVSFRYSTQPGDERALRGVSYSIEEGEFVGITGVSGAGKSTFCRTLAGQIPHFYQGEFDGTVRIDGVDTRARSIGDLATDVGFVFENPYNQLTGATSTVLEEVAFGLETLVDSREEMKRRARDALATIGVEGLADRDPMQLSGGQSQRVAIASVVAMRPRILVLQQPTAQLDPEGTEEVMEVVAQMNREGYTVVFVSQDLERLAPHLDRLAVFDGGRIALDGPPRDVLGTAEADDLPVLVPPPVRIGYRLRESGRIPAAEPLPLTLEECAEELSGVVETASDRGVASAVDDDVPPSPGATSPNDAASPQSAVDSASTAPVTDSAADSACRSDDANGRVEARGEVVLDDLHHTYEGGVHALRGVSFSLDDGCVCLVGQNGAGKSTLVKHLNGLLKPTEGRVAIQGVDTTEQRVAQLSRRVGLSFQNPDDQLFHSTVEEEVRYGPRNMGYSEDVIDELTERAIERAGLTDVREKNPYDLGDPWRKRVAVASVVAMDTPIVVLDEPTGGQDAPGHDLLGDIVEALVKDGKLVVVIAHDMDFVAEHADRVIALARGTVLLDGDPATVLSDRETLSEADVRPPQVTRIGTAIGLAEPVLSLDELYRRLDVQTH